MSLWFGIIEHTENLWDHSLCEDTVPTDTVHPCMLGESSAGQEPAAKGYKGHGWVVTSMDHFLSFTFKVRFLFSEEKTRTIASNKEEEHHRFDAKLSYHAITTRFQALISKREITQEPSLLLL